MGMYTELHYNVELRRDVPQEVLDVLAYMTRGREDAPVLPDEQFFSLPRWRSLFTMDSYYFAADTHSTLRFDDIAGRFFLNVRSNLKNYGGEIQSFLNWIDPYVEAAPGDFLGFFRYEESEEPTLIRKLGGEDADS